MRISEVTISDLKQYANVFDGSDDNLFSAILIAGKMFISNYTGLPLTEPTPPSPLPDGYVTPDHCDNHEDLTIALMVLSTEMYDNRSIIVENNKLNFVIKTILDSHSVSLL